MGGLCVKSQLEEDQKSKNKKQAQLSNQSQVQNVDVVKVKLKQARDKIKNFINLKNKDIDQIDIKIKEKLPKYQQTGSKKELVPLLKAKKDLQTLIDNADVRLKLVNQKLDEVQMQKMNAETISVLEDSNKYIQDIQKDLEAKDWRNVIAQAQQKYEIQWPDDRQEIQQDPAFQQMWAEIGGNKIPAKKTVAVNVQNQQKQKEKEEMVA